MPPYNSIAIKLYSALLEYQIVDIFDFKYCEFAIRGHSSFLVLSDLVTFKSDHFYHIKNFERNFNVLQMLRVKIEVIGAGVSGLCTVRHCCKFLQDLSKDHK